MAGDDGRGASGRADEDATAPFALLGNETRMAAVRALADRQRDHPDDPHLGFADLRRAAGVPDSGNFNYHLDRLVGRFVAHEAAGYRLTYAGVEVAAAVAAGAYDAPEDRGPEPVDAACPLCDRDLAARYEDGVLAVTCEAGHRVPADGLPAGVVADRSLREAAGLLDRRTRRHVRAVLAGDCPLCSGPVSLAGERLSGDQPPVPVLYSGTCERCGMPYDLTAGAAVVEHPAVTAFHWEHGVDPRERRYWEFPFVTGENTAVASSEPLRVTVDVSLEGAETLVLTLDDEAAVRDATRT